MTKAQIAEQKQKAMLSTRSIKQLICLWDITEAADITVEMAIVRGWLMDEFERRDEAAFDRWMESDKLDANPAEFYM